MNPGFLSRRQLLAAAGVSAVGMAIQDVSWRLTLPGRKPPRLPLSILVRGELQDSYLQQIQQLSPQIKIDKGIALGDADVIFGNISGEQKSHLRGNCVGFSANPPASSIIHSMRWTRRASR